MFCTSELPMWFQVGSMLCGAWIVIACALWGAIAMWRSAAGDGLFFHALASAIGVVAGTALGAIACVALGGLGMCIMFVLTVALC